MRSIISKKTVTFIASAVLMTLVFAMPVMADTYSFAYDAEDSADNSYLNVVPGTLNAGDVISVSNAGDYYPQHGKDLHIEIHYFGPDGSTLGFELYDASSSAEIISKSGFTSWTVTQRNAAPQNEQYDAYYFYLRAIGEPAVEDNSLIISSAEARQEEKEEEENDDDDKEEPAPSNGSSQSSWTPAPASAKTTVAQSAATQLSTAQTSLAALSVIPTATKEVYKTVGMDLNMTSVNTIDANTTKLIAANSDIPYNVTFLFLGKPMVCKVPARFNYAQFTRADGTMNIHEVLWAVYSGRWNKTAAKTNTRSTGRR